MAGIGSGGGIDIMVGTKAQGMMTQKESPLGQLLKESNQLSAPINQGQVPLSMSIENSFTRLQEKGWNTNVSDKGLAQGENLGNPSFNANVSIANKQIKSFSVMER